MTKEEKTFLLGIDCPENSLCIYFQSTPTRVLPPPPLHPPQQSAVKIDIPRNQQITPQNS